MIGWGRQTRFSAKVQIGAELLCKSAKVDLGVGVGTGVGVGKYFQVSGLGNREPGSGVQVRVQVQDLNFPAPAPVPDNPHLRPEGRDLRPESASYVCIFAARSARSADPTYYSRGNLEPAAEG